MVQFSSTNNEESSIMDLNERIQNMDQESRILDEEPKISFGVQEYRINDTRYRIRIKRSQNILTL